MIRFLALLLITLLPYLQTSDSHYRVYVGVCCVFEDQTWATAERVMPQVQAELEQHNIIIDLDGVDDPFPVQDDDGLAEVVFFEIFDEYRVIVDFAARIYPLQSHLRNVSPLLRDDFGISIFTSRKRATTDLIVAVLAYATGNCDLIMKIDANQIYGVNFYHANCAVIQGDYELAARLYRLVLYDYNAQRQYSLATATNLAWTYLQLGKGDVAFEFIDGVISSAQSRSDIEGEIDALVVRSQLYALAFRYGEAIADMDAAIALDPNNPALYVERGQRNILTYEWDRALADYNHALELDSTYVDAYYYRGVLYASIPEGIDARQLALDDFQRYLDLAPDGQHADDAERHLTEIQAQLASLTAEPSTP